MSYILEALKKSEQERQIGHVPDLSMAQETPQRAAPRWPRWLLAALLLNAVVLVVLAWRVWEARMSDSVPSVRPADVPSMSEPPVVLGEPAIEAEAAATPAPEASAPPPPDLPEAVSQMPAPMPEPPAVPQQEWDTPPLGPDLEALPAVDGLDTATGVARWEDLPPEVRAGLPVPRIDVHVFAQEPERRFVLINLRKYLQGDTLEDGAVIEAILADGIVLSFQGQQYRVERP